MNSMEMKKFSTNSVIRNRLTREYFRTFGLNIARTYWKMPYFSGLYAVIMTVLLLVQLSLVVLLVLSIRYLRKIRHDKRCGKGSQQAATPPSKTVDSSANTPSLQQLASTNPSAATFDLWTQQQPKQSIKSWAACQSQKPFCITTTSRKTLNPYVKSLLRETYFKKLPMLQLILLAWFSCKRLSLHSLYCTCSISSK